MSLRETCAWAEATGIASLSDPSLLERLAKAAPWLGDVVGALIGEQAAVPTGRWAGHRLRALDATTVCQPGADHTTWRLHVGYDLASAQVDHIALTDGRGAESLRRFAYRPGDIALADRGYARPPDLRLVIEAGADFIVRTGTALWTTLLGVAGISALEPVPTGRGLDRSDLQSCLRHACHPVRLSCRDIPAGALPRGPTPAAARLHGIPRAQQSADRSPVRVPSNTRQRMFSRIRSALQKRPVSIFTSEPIQCWPDI